MKEVSYLEVELDWKVYIIIVKTELLNELVHASSQEQQNFASV